LILPGDGLCGGVGWAECVASQKWRRVIWTGDIVLILRVPLYTSIRPLSQL
jgi:hypothetical protein